jgi:hypothetical protein
MLEPPTIDMSPDRPPIDASPVRIEIDPDD